MQKCCVSNDRNAESNQCIASAKTCADGTTHTPEFDASKAVCGPLKAEKTGKCEDDDKRCCIATVGEFTKSRCGHRNFQCDSLNSGVLTYVESRTHSTISNLECTAVKGCAAHAEQICCADNLASPTVSKCVSALNRGSADVKCAAPTPHRIFAGDSETVPKKFAAYTHTKFPKLIAGISMGRYDQSYYWTLGAVACNKAVPADRFAITNMHNVEDSGLEQRPYKVTEKKVIQPSSNTQDREDAKAAGIAASELTNDKSLVGQYADWMKYSGDTWDAALLKFDVSKRPAAGEVLTWDGTKGVAAPVLGAIKWSKLRQLFNAATVASKKFILYAAGRSSGWNAVQLVRFISDEKLEFDPSPRDVNDPTSFNDRHMAKGDSGSFLWYKDEDSATPAFWAVGLFDGNKYVRSVQSILADIKTSKSLDLYVCNVCDEQKTKEKCMEQEYTKTIGEKPQKLKRCFWDAGNSRCWDVGTAAGLIDASLAPNTPASATVVKGPSSASGALNPGS